MKKQIIPHFLLLTILENKKVIAQSQVTISISKDNVVSGTIQHELVDQGTTEDTSDDTTLEEGSEQTLSFTPEQGKQLIDAITPILSAVINASTPPATTTEVIAEAPTE